MYHHGDGLSWAGSATSSGQGIRSIDMHTVIPQNEMDTPGRFRIRVHGSPSRQWVTGMVGNVEFRSEQTSGGTETILTANLLDQASLIGFVNALYNQGHAILSVERLPSETADESPEQDQQPPN